MNYIFFNGILLFGGFIAVLVFSFGLMACLAPLALFRGSQDPSKAFTLPITAIAGIYQVYFWGFWSAFCVAMTTKYTQKPEVTWDWLYWITGFMECISLIAWLAHKERQSSQSLEEVRGIQKGTSFYSLVAVVAFLVFAFAPRLMVAPYGWVLKPLGLHSYISQKAENSAKTDEEARKTIEAFFAGYEYAISANKLARGIPTSKDRVGDFEKVKALLDKARERLSECDTHILNKIYNGWGDILSNKFIPAINLHLAGSQAQGDRNDLARGDALMAEFDRWLQQNWNQILVRLYQEYGFDIKK